SPTRSSSRPRRSSALFRETGKRHPRGAVFIFGLGLPAVDTFLQQLINGLTAGSVYAVVALGYTMVYGIIQLINFAHGDVVMIGGAAITTVQIAILAICFGLMAALAILIYRTPLGTAMRATAQNQQVAGLMGIDINRVIAATFVIGAGLGAVAGVLYGTYYGLAQYTMGSILGLKAFSAAVLGGIGNIPGAMLGGVLLGIVEALGAGYIGDLTNLCQYDFFVGRIDDCAGGGNFVLFGSNYQDVFAFLVLILVLVFRPSGLLGERVGERA